MTEKAPRPSENQVSVNHKMNDKDKTKDQLVHELVELRQQIAELKASETASKEAEEEFRKAQEPFTGIYEYSKDAMGYSNLEGVLLDVNDSFLRLTGYSKEELLNGRKYQDFTPKEYHEFEAQMIKNVLRTGEPVEYEKEYVTKDGSRVPVLLTVFIVKGIDGKPVALAAIIKDITERRSIYEKSQKQAEELRVLYEDLGKRNRELEILNSITQAVNKSLNLEEIYGVALDMVIEQEYVDLACIYLVDETKNEAILQDHRNFPDDFLRRASRIPYPKGATWKVIISKEILNVKNAHEDSDVGPAGRDLGFRSMLGIPIAIEDSTLKKVLAVREHFESLMINSVTKQS